MEEDKGIDNILKRNKLSLGVMTDDEIKFLHGGYSVSESDAGESV